jgi:hypothetical protein
MDEKEIILFYKIFQYYFVPFLYYIKFRIFITENIDLFLCILYEIHPYLFYSTALYITM